MVKILIVEDEQPIRNLLKMNLEDAGYDCTCAEDGQVASDILEDHNFDLILLDIMLPIINGYELFEYIKPLNIPVIFLTAKDALEDKVKGLTIGAEDYIVKPFELIELLARIDVVLRRYNKNKTTLSYKDIVIDSKNKTVLKANAPIDLTPKEFELFEMLVQNVNITLFRNKIYETIWDNDSYGDTRTLDLHIQRLRKKLELGDSLKTIYKTGYRLEA